MKCLKCLRKLLVLHRLKLTLCYHKELTREIITIMSNKPIPSEIVDNYIRKRVHDRIAIEKAIKKIKAL